jgi:hypothetical protein
MKQVLIGFVFFIALGISEFFVYHILRAHDVPAIPGIVITLLLCMGSFALFGGLFLFRDPSHSSAFSRAAGSSRTSNPVTSPSGIRRAATASYRPEELTADGFTNVAIQGVPNPIKNITHVQSEAFRDELYNALEAKRAEIAALLAESGKELSRFDTRVLKTLERNSPGSVEGVVIARKIYTALEVRCKEIEHFLSSLPITNPEKGQQLLHGDLEIPDANKLTSVFKTRPIPPIKMSEVGFQLKVFLKRISRRRSIFRGNMIEVEQFEMSDSGRSIPSIMPLLEPPPEEQAAAAPLEEGETVVGEDAEALNVSPAQEENTESTEQEAGEASELIAEEVLPPTEEEGSAVSAEEGEAAAAGTDVPQADSTEEAAPQLVVNDGSTREITREELLASAAALAQLVEEEDEQAENVETAAETPS